MKLFRLHLFVEYKTASSYNFYFVLRSMVMTSEPLDNISEVVWTRNINIPAHFVVCQQLQTWRQCENWSLWLYLTCLTHKKNFIWVVHCLWKKVKHRDTVHLCTSPCLLQGIELLCLKFCFLFFNSSWFITFLSNYTNQLHEMYSLRIFTVFLLHVSVYHTPSSGWTYVPFTQTTICDAALVYGHYVGVVNYEGVT
jgi:hypothetical protein